jgi:hypothetical protein
MLKLSIIKPCHENWCGMAPIEQGAYCTSCCKQVIDFTSMQDEDIVGYFQKHNNEPICGRFRNDQMSRPLIDIPVSVFAMRIPFWKKFLAALFIYFSSFIAGCTTSTDHDYTKAELPVAGNWTNVPTKSYQTNNENAVSTNPDLNTSKRQNIFTTMGLTGPIYHNSPPSLPALTTH